MAPLRILNPHVENTKCCIIRKFSLTKSTLISGKTASNGIKYVRSLRPYSFSRASYRNERISYRIETDGTHT